MRVIKRVAGARSALHRVAQNPSNRLTKASSRGRPDSTLSIMSIFAPTPFSPEDVNGKRGHTIRIGAS
jgi:hypothetical protein